MADWAICKGDSLLLEISVRQVFKIIHFKENDQVNPEQAAPKPKRRGKYSPQDKRLSNDLVAGEEVLLAALNEEEAASQLEEGNYTAKVL